MLSPGPRCFSTISILGTLWELKEMRASEGKGVQKFPEGGDVILSPRCGVAAGATWS